MPNLIWFEWEKCADGYAIEELQPEYVRIEEHPHAKWPYIMAKEKAPAWVHSLAEFWGAHSPNDTMANLQSYDSDFFFVPKSERSVRFHPLDQDQAAFMEFCEESEDGKAELNFVSKYGFPSLDINGIYQRFYRVEEYQEQAAALSESVDAWRCAKETGDFSKLVSDFNRAEDLDRYNRHDRQFAEVNLQLRIYPGTKKPSLTVTPSDLEAALWLQFGQAVSADTKLRRCSVCPSWFSYGTGTGRRKSAHYCSDRCRKAAHRRQKAG